MNPKPFITAYIFTQISDGYGHVRVSFGLKERDENDNVANTSPSYHPKAPWVEGLLINSQTDRNISFANPLYGYSVDYRNIYSTDLRSLERMVKTLRRVQTGLDKLYRKWGVAATFGDYVTRVFHILKVKEVLWIQDGANTSIPVESVSGFINGKASEVLQALKS